MSDLDPPGISWRDCWYPVTFAEDMPQDRPFGFSVYDFGLVLFVDGNGQIVCLRDRCPHRAARLSDGQITDGKLECLYHGWQYDRAGDCVFIPQMIPGKDYPIRSCVESFAVAEKTGIIWVWPGDQAQADPDLIPSTPGGTGEGVFDVSFQMDLPYDQTYLIENVIDIAHIHIAHDGVRGGGLREAAKPLEFKIHQSDHEGIRASFRSIGLERSEDDPDVGGASVEFVAPNLVRYASNYSSKDLVAGLELYSIPLGKGRCRLLYRKYSNFTSLRERLKPRWLEHQTQCLILEQDMSVVVGQHAEIEKEGRALRDLWLPIKTSDRLVVEYRKWLDTYGSALPFVRGFTTAHNSAPNEGRARHDRRHLHTRVCKTCSRLLRRLELGQRALGALSVLLLGVALFAGAQAALPLVALAGLFGFGILGLGLLKTRI